MIEFMNDYIMIGFRIVLPIFCATLLLNAILGVLAKVSPQMNMFAVGIQLKVLTGLISNVSDSGNAAGSSGFCLSGDEEDGGVLYRRYDVSLEYNLQFFAAEGQGGEKTEPATEKKLTDARKEGQVAKSREIANGLGLLAVFLVLKLWVGHMGYQFINVFSAIYEKIPEVVTFWHGNMPQTDANIAFLRYDAGIGDHYGTDITDRFCGSLFKRCGAGGMASHGQTDAAQILQTESGLRIQEDLFRQFRGGADQIFAEDWTDHIHML